MTNLLTSKLKGQVSVQQLQQYAIAFVVIGVVLTVGLSVLGGVKEGMVVSEAVTDEAKSPATPFPTNVTVDKASKSTFVSVVDGSETVTFYDSNAGSNTTLTAGTDYNSFYDSGKFGLLNTTTTEDYNASEDKVYLDYSAEMELESAQKGASSAMEGLTTFTGWLPVIALVIVAVIIIGLVSMFRSGNNGRRGRA